MGDVFAGRYELIDPLGEGAGGAVWRVWDRKTEAFLAAKILRHVDATSLLRFMREQALRIHHPHVVTPLGWAGDDDRVLFTMPIMHGGSAATLVGDYGPLPDAWVARLLDQLLQALAAIHAEGIVHRDVKPANLLLDATGVGEPHARLSDFGLAIEEDAPRLTELSFVLGTPGYLAPELTSRRDSPSAATDLFAAGMTAARLRLGTLPPDLHAALAAHWVAPGLAAVITSLTAPDARDRTHSAHAALQALRATGLTTSSLGSDIEVLHQTPPLPDAWQHRLQPDERSTLLRAAPVAPSVEAPASTRPATRRRVPAIVWPLAAIGAGALLLASAAISSLA